MSVEAKSLATGVGTGAAVAVYQAPPSTTAVIKAAVFCNTTAGSDTFTVYANDGLSRTLIYNQSLGAGDNYKAGELAGLVLEANESIVVDAPVGFDYWISGIEVR